MALVADEFSPEIRRFIAERFRSVEQLEILILLRLEGEEGLTVESLSRQLRSSNNSVQSRLKDLENHGLIRKKAENLYFYAPKDVEAERLVSSLAKLYVTHRVSVINIIYTGKNDQLRDFADAFRLRKGEGGDV